MQVHRGGADVLMQRCLLVHRCWFRCADADVLAGAGAVMLVQRGGGETEQVQRWCKSDAEVVLNESNI